MASYGGIFTKVRADMVFATEELYDVTAYEASGGVNFTGIINMINAGYVHCVRAVWWIILPRSVRIGSPN